MVCFTRQLFDCFGADILRHSHSLRFLQRFGKHSHYCTATYTRPCAGPSPDKRGGLNGSMQHLLKVYLKESARLNSFA
jgi:hypothetical protein